MGKRDRGEGAGVYKGIRSPHSLCPPQTEPGGKSMAVVRQPCMILSVIVLLNGMRM